MTGTLRDALRAVAATLRGGGWTEFDAAQDDASLMAPRVLSALRADPATQAAFAEALREACRMHNRWMPPLTPGLLDAEVKFRAEVAPYDLGDPAARAALDVLG